MMNETRHIDLHLPKGWNQCTTDELEHIAAAIILCQQRVDRYHPFDWAQVKLMAVLAINGIEVVSNGDDEYMVKRKEDSEPWPITTGQLYSLTEQLAWIDDKKADKTVFQFPYPELTLVQGSGFRVLSSRVWRCNQGSKPLTINREPLTVAGPPPLLDGYSWQEYRWLTDWMQEYMRCENAKRDSTAARNEFLAILFKPKGETFNVQCSMFNDFDPVKWQVILFWWSSLMAILARKFPKVFKQQPVGKRQRQQKADTPWDFYNRVIATIQKYVGGLSEENVNHASYGTILQQLEMMVREAEEMDRISKQSKSRK